MLIKDFKYIMWSQKNEADIEETKKTNILVVDNEATVSMDKSYKPTKKNRHIARRFHYVREGERTQEHHLEWIPEEDQIEDDMTKTQGMQTIMKHVKRTLVELPEHMALK